jgi:glutaredoxin 2
MIMAGNPHKPAARDLWRERCDALAAELHFDDVDLFEWFEQLWMCRVKELRWPIKLAKWMALHDVRGSLDKRGQESD